MRRRIFAAWLAAVLSLNLFVAYQAWSSREEIFRMRRVDVGRGARVMLTQAELTVVGIQRTLTGIAETLRLYPGGLTRGDHEVFELLRRARTDNPLARSIIVLDAQGHLLHDADVPVALDIDLSDREYFSSLAADPQRQSFIDHPVAGRTSNKWFLPISRPIVGGGGEFLGVVVAIIDPSRFEQMFRRLLPHPQASIAIYHADGVVIGRVPGDGALTGRSAVQALAFLPDYAREPFGIGVLHSPFTGEERLDAFSRSADQPLVVSVSHQVADIEANWWSRAQWLIYIAVGGSVMATLAALFAWGQAHRRQQLDQELSVALVEKHEVNEALRRAQQDHLTGLSSRPLFLEEVALMAEGCRSGDQRLALLYVDLDGFKQINDRLGHQGGDGVLEQAADVLRSALRDTDVAGRLGGDEFAVALAAPAALIDQLSRLIARRIVTRMAEIGHGLGCSVGIALCPPHCPDLGCAMRHADEAMYRAKRAGKNRFVMHPYSEAACQDCCAVPQLAVLAD